MTGWKNTDESPCPVCGARKGEWHLLVPPLSNRTVLLTAMLQWLTLVAVCAAVLLVLAVQAIQIKVGP